MMLNVVVVGLLARGPATHLLQTHIQGVISDFSSVAPHIHLDWQHMMRLKPSCCCVHHGFTCHTQRNAVRALNTLIGHPTKMLSNSTHVR